MAYMEMFGNCAHSTQNTAEFMRHSVHTYNMNHASSEHINATSKHIQQHNRIISHSQTMSLSPIQKQAIGEFSSSQFPLNLSFEYLPPALPPKRQISGSKTSSLMGTPISSPKLSQSMHYESVADTTTTLSTSTSMSSQYPQNSAHTSTVDNRNMVGNLASSFPRADFFFPLEDSWQQGQIDRTSSTTTITDQLPLDTPSTSAAPSIASSAAAMSAGIAAPPTDLHASVCRATNGADPTTIVSTAAVSAATVPATNKAINKQIKKSNDNSNVIYNRIDNNKHYMPLYNDYNCKNDGTKESNIVVGGSGGGTGGDADVNKEQTVKQKNDDGANNGNDLNMRNSCWENNNDDVVLRNPIGKGQSDEIKTKNADKTNSTISLIEEIDVYQYLVLRKEGEDGPDVKGGSLDALIVHATKVQKVCDNAFGEAFITTFRTFITPLELIEKLTHRYTIFCCQINDLKQKSAKESFSLLVRVVNDLTAPDLTPNILLILNEFVYQLVCAGQLMMAKLLRNNILEKIIIFKQQKWIPPNPILPSRAIITSPPTLLDLKSADIAEQMTLLDAELFQKIEIPEVLIWAQEQCEERSPNLTRFTEHFNKMSYWARSQILKQEDAKDREKHVIKFIKIMKHLRKINNYNSYLALLSALDSAPIRRLEWHKNITEGLKEYCALIDSSSSFRAYRQALSETNPPCIPYIGLVLQDLTFVHIGNPDFLNSSIINFSKRWQQHNIVVNMKRFKKCSAYPFKKSERIIGFFDNFENYLDEDAMWQISENIKPRISRKTMPQN